MAHKLFSKDALAKLLVTAVVASSSAGGTVAFAGGTSSTTSATQSTLNAENDALLKLSQDLTALQNQLQVDGTLTVVNQAQTNAKSYNWAAAMPQASSSLVNALSSLITITTLASLSTDSSTQSANVQQIKTILHNLDPSLTGSVMYDLYTKFRAGVEQAALMNIALNNNPAAPIDYGSEVASALQSAVTNTPVVAGVLQSNGVQSSSVAGIVTTALSSIDPQHTAVNAIVEAMIHSHISLTAPFSPISVTNGSTVNLPGVVLSNLPPSLSQLAGQPLPPKDYAYTVTPNDAAVSYDNSGWTLKGTSATPNATVTLYLAGEPIASTTLTVQDPTATQTVTQISNSGTTTKLATITVPTDGSAPVIPPAPIQGTTLTANLNVPSGALQPGETVTLTSNVDTTTLQQVVNKTIPANQAPTLVFGVSFSGAAPSKPITLTIGGGTGKDAIPSNAVVYKLTDTGEIPMPSNSYSVVNGVLTITFSTDPYFIVAVPQGNSGNSNGNGNVPGPTGTPAQVASATNSTVNLSAISVQAGQSVTISGVVKDDAGKAIANRTVIAQFDDKTGVTVSGADGSYSVTLTPDKPVTNGPVTVKVDQAVISNSTDVITVAQSTVPTPQGPTIDMLKSITFNLGTFKVDSKATTFTKTVGNTTVQVTVPAGAFTSNGFVSVIGTVDPSVLGFSLNGFLPGGSHPEEAFGLLYTGSAPVVPLTVSVTNPAITSGATVFNISTGGASLAGSAQTGSVTVSASSNPYFLVVQIPQPQQPPVSTPPKQGPGPQSHNFNTSGVYVNDKKVSAAPTFVENKTTYMPIYYVTQTLKSLGFTVKWDGKTKTWTLTAPKSAKVDFSSIKLNSGDVTIKLNGKVVYKAPEIVATDPNSNTDTTFLPIWYVMQTLKRAGINSTWNGSTWKVTGKH